MGYRFFRYTKDDGSGNPIFYNRDGTQLAIMEKGTNLTTIIGPGLTGDDLILKANAVDAESFIRLYGNGNITLIANAAIQFGKPTASVYGYIDGTADMRIASYANKNISFVPNGTGKVKFGAEITNAGSDRGKLVNFLLADGTSVHIKTYDTV